MAPDVEKIEEASTIEEFEGSSSSQEDKLMQSVVENDEETVKDGRLVSEVLHQGFSSFNPDMMFEQITKDYATAENIYGEKLLRLVSGYDPSYIKRNIKIPEFKKELLEKITRQMESLKDKKIVLRDGTFTEEGFKLAGYVMYMDEIDRLHPEGFSGEKVHKKNSHYGEKEDARMFRHGDRFKDIAIKASVKTAIRRNHKTFTKHDLKTWERKRRGSVYVIYVLDASGSMRGAKIEVAKRAGIGLAFRAIQNKDKVGLVVFGKEIKEEIPPTTDFKRLLHAIAKIRPSKETDMVASLKKSIEMFPPKKVTKHIVLLSDALPNIGEDPERETLEIVSQAHAEGITISVIGINLDTQGKDLARRIATIGEGRCYIAKANEEIDVLMLEDYYLIR
jgi:Mg-chelatase subunit ChlD